MLGKTLAWDPGESLLVGTENADLDDLMSIINVASYLCSLKFQAPGSGGPKSTDHNPLAPTTSMSHFHKKCSQQSTILKRCIKSKPRKWQNTSITRNKSSALRCFFKCNSDGDLAELHGAPTDKLLLPSSYACWKSCWAQGQNDGGYLAFQSLTREWCFHTEWYQSVWFAKQ